MDTHQPFPEPAGGNPQSFSLHEIANVIMEAIHVIDFHDRSFLYVTDRPFFLYGYTPEEVKKMGFDFFKKVVHEDDYIWLKKLQGAIQQHDHPDEIRYFSFSLRIKNKETGVYIMADHKLIPRFIDGQLRYAICLLSCSILNKSGNLRAYHHNGTGFDEYDTKKQKWKMNTVKPLTKREREVLIWAKQGKSNEQISAEMEIKHQSVRNILTSIYRKLNVYSSAQAVNYATQHHLIFVSDQQKGEKTEETPAAKKQRRPLTPEKLLKIQDALNIGKSVNSIAKQENVSESAIRYQIDHGKLMKWSN